MKSRSHRYDMKRPRISHVHKHTKYKICQGRMMVVCIKQHLSNISSSIHLNVKRDWGWLEKKCAECITVAI